MAAGSIVLIPEQAILPSSTAAAYKRIDGTNFPFSVLAFDASSDRACYFKVQTPGYSTGNLTVKFHWNAASATSNDVVWESAFAAVTPDTDTGDLSSKSFATAQSVTDTHLGTNAGHVMVATLTLSNIDSLADGDVCILRVKRLGSNGADTMSGDAYLERITLAWT
jgi:hypothetical protein